MKNKIDKNIGKSKYLQLTDLLKAEIEKLHVGDKFYTQLEVMKKYKLSCATVSRAMQELTEAGFLTRKTGGGTFIKSPFPPEKDIETSEMLFLVFPAVSVLRDVNPLNWFVKDEIQKGILHSYTGNCQFVSSEAYLKEPERYSKLIAMNPSAEMSELLDSTGAKYVAINQTQKFGQNSNNININHMPGIVDGIAYLVKELGHRKIAIITSALSAHSERIAAFQIGMRTFDLAISDEFWIKAENGSPEGGYNAMKKLLSLKERPSAVFVDTDTKASGAMDAVKDAGVNIPHDISIIGFDDIPDAKEMDPPLTTVNGMYFEMGAEAVRLLEEKCARKLSDIPSITINTKLIIRKSCAKVKGP